MKKTMKLLLPILALFLLCCLGKPVDAEDTLKLEKTSVTFDYKKGEEYSSIITVNIAKGSEKIKIAETSNDKIADVDFYDDHIDIYATGEGSCTITVTGMSGATVNVNATITGAFMKKYFADSFFLFGTWNGSKKITIYGPEGSSGTFTVAKKTYKYSIGAKKEAVVKLKKPLKINAKYKFTAKKGKYSTVLNGTIYSVTWIMKVKGSGKKIKVTVFSPHKGDIIKVEYGGKVYKKVFNKNKDLKNKVVKFITSKKVKKNAKIKITIYNKYKKKLDKQVIRLKKGKWDVITI